MPNVRPTLAASRAREGGFSLIELLIAVVVVGVLLAVALPTFSSSQRKSRRSDAMAALSAVQLAQERWRSNHTTYGATADVMPATTSASGYYSLSVDSDSNTATGYIAQASAVSGSPQASDSPCVLMAVRMSDGMLSYGSSSGTTIDWADASKCWVR
jgi:type IV pilus assembly protein PilE